MALPELPINFEADLPVEVPGDPWTKPVKSTHRGFLPENHEDKRPVIQTPNGAARYKEV